MPGRNFTDEQEAVIAQEYRNGISQRSLATKYGVDRCCIKGALRRQKVETRSKSDCNRVYALGRPDAFNTIDSEEKAYWWGFLYADGHVYRNTLAVVLRSKDEQQIVKLRDFLQSENPITNIMQKSSQEPRRKYPARKIEFSDRQLGKDLRRLGINVDRKGFNKAIQNLPENLVRHWIRGFLDGDGSVQRNGDISFCGKREVVKWVRDTLAEHASTNPNLKLSKHTTANAYYLKISGRVQALKVVDYLYPDATIWMERKKKIADSWPQKRGRIKPPQCYPGYVIKRKRGAE